jgi:cupin domain
MPSSRSTGPSPAKAGGRSTSPRSTLASSYPASCISPPASSGRENKPNPSALLDEERVSLSVGVAMVIPAGTEHNVINTSATEPLRLYTVYSSPEHPDGTVHRTKQEAEVYERERHG